MSNYTKYSDSNIVSYGHDLNHIYGYKLIENVVYLNSTPEQCMSYCDSNEKCGGFAISTSSDPSWRGKCYLYDKTSATSGMVDAFPNNWDIYNKNLNLDISLFIANSKKIPKTYNSTNYKELTDYASKHKIIFPDDCTTDACKIEYVQKHMRDNIDSKMAEIYQSHGTNTQALNENLQNTLILGVVWAMLGTTALYYTFKNL